MNTLWVMRHGLAESQFDTDFNRALSVVGEQQAENVARKIKTAGDLPQRMLVSPFRRTQETAKVVHSILELDFEFETEDMLVHFGDHRILGDYLLTLAEKKIMIVSHMPIVANLCSYLCPSDQVMGFQTAQVAKIEFADEIGKIKNTMLAD